MVVSLEDTALPLLLALFFPDLLLGKQGKPLRLNQILGAGSNLTPRQPAGGSPDFCAVASSLAGNNVLTSSVNFYYYRLSAVLSVIRAAVLNAWTQVCAKKNIDLFF